MNPRGDRARTLYTGLGLAFGLGWLWFPWLGAAWLPGLLWGDSSSGGGGAFLLMLVAGFGAGGILAARLHAPNENGNAATAFLFRHSRPVCHAVAWLLLLVALLLRLYGPRNLPGTWPYLALSAAVAAYVIVGLYWGGRLIALERPDAPAAFFVTVAAAAAMGQAVAFLSLKTQLLVWPQSILIAAGLAEVLAHLEKPQPKTRGRPPKADPKPTYPPLALGDGESVSASRLTLALLAAVLFCVGFTDGAALPLHGGHIAVPSAWLAGIFFGVGALVPALAVARPASPNARGLIAATAITVGAVIAALVSHRHPFVGCLFQYFTEGTVSGVGVCLLAGMSLEKGLALRRAGIAIAACTAAMSCGRLVGEAVGDRTDLPLAAGLAIAVCIALFWRPLATVVGVMRRRRRVSTAGLDTAWSGGNGATPGFSRQFLVGFTEEEARIIELLVREGMSNQAIATHLFITRSTVRYHLKKLYAKTNTSDRDELVRYVLQNYRPSAKDTRLS